MELFIAKGIKTEMKIEEEEEEEEKEIYCGSEIDIKEEVLEFESYSVPQKRGKRTDEINEPHSSVKQIGHFVSISKKKMASKDIMENRSIGEQQTLSDKPRSKMVATDNSQTTESQSISDEEDSCDDSIDDPDFEAGVSSSDSENDMLEETTKKTYIKNEASTSNHSVARNERKRTFSNHGADDDSSNKDESSEKSSLLTLLLDSLKHTYSDDLRIGNYVFSHMSCIKNQPEDKVKEETYVKMCKSVAIRRLYDKRQSCLYCNKSLAKIGRHYLEQHSLENAVQEIGALPIKSLFRKDKLELLRLAGNFKHNLRTLSRKSGELYVQRRPTVSKSCPKSTEYVPCLFCLGFFHRRQAAKHIRNCKFSKTNESCHYVNLGYNILYLALGNDKWIFAEIISKMRNDKIKKVVENDRIICEYGSMLLTKKGPTQKEQISNKMRELARLVIEANKISTKNNHLGQYIKSSEHALLLKAALSMTCDATPGNQKPLTLGVRIGHSLKEVCDLLKVQAIISADLVMKQDLEDFLYLMENEWSNKLSVPKMRNALDLISMKIPPLPETDDLIKLFKKIKELIPYHIQKLNDYKDLANWGLLANVTLAWIILFNKRREGEASKILLVDYTERLHYKLSQPKEILDSLSESEKVLAERLEMFQVRGKRNNRVPILMTPIIQEAIQLLCITRNEVGISKTNKYLFANSTENEIRGSEALNLCISKCTLICPDKIKSTTLRKYVCTVSQVMELSDNELKFLTKHMGHNLNVHLQYYRLHDSSIETMKVAKLLLAIDEGKINLLKGQSMEEVALEKIIPEYNSFENNENVIDDNTSSNFDSHKIISSAQAGTLSAIHHQTGASFEPKINDNSAVNTSDRNDIPGKVQIHQKWDPEVKKKALEFFAAHIISKKAPGKLHCMEFMQNNGISNKTWLQVKTLIYNTYNKTN